jgi:hypothetical protein
MINLHLWLQWPHTFQPHYGSLILFISQNEDIFRSLTLLETSACELFRLPENPTQTDFERELNAMHVRSAVGYLCALIVQEGAISQFPFNTYQTLMINWFRQLRSSVTLGNTYDEAMRSILDFLECIPTLIGQAGVVEVLVLAPLEQIFDRETEKQKNIRSKLWQLADVKQKAKLELWGYALEINEWKNEKKWSEGKVESDESPSISVVAHNDQGSKSSRGNGYR